MARRQLADSFKPPGRTAGQDGHMTTPDMDAAARFLAATGRVLDRRRFGRLFGTDGPGPVRDAVAAYRNPDGGFGHALEPDGRCPGSQPLAIALALATLDEAGAWDDELVQGALGWLELHAPAAAAWWRRTRPSRAGRAPRGGRPWTASFPRSSPPGWWPGHCTCAGSGIPGWTGPASWSGP